MLLLLGYASVDAANGGWGDAPAAGPLAICHNTTTRTMKQNAALTSYAQEVRLSGMIADR